jgi:hypothetical protein
MTRLIALLTILLMTVGTVIADESKSSVTKGQTDSGTIRLKSKTNPYGVTKTRGTINGERVRFTTRTKPVTPAVTQPSVGREKLGKDKD